MSIEVLFTVMPVNSGSHELCFHYTYSEFSSTQLETWAVRGGSWLCSISRIPVQTWSSIHSSVGAAGPRKQGWLEWHALLVRRRALLLHRLLCSLSLGHHRGAFPLPWWVWCLHGNKSCAASSSGYECLLPWYLKKTHCALPYFSKDNMRLCSVHLGHGEQEDINGHDAEGGCWSALQTVHLPHPTEHEVITDETCLCLCTCIKAIRPPRCDLLT